MPTRTRECNSGRMAVCWATYAFSQSPLSRATRPFIASILKGSSGSRPCGNMISNAGYGLRDNDGLPADARSQVTIACISGLMPKMLIIRFIL